MELGHNKPMSIPITTDASDSSDERQCRQAAIDFARGNVRLESFVLSPEGEAVSQRYIQGELTITEFVQAMKDLASKA
jgi:hypothetical protein